MTSMVAEYVIDAHTILWYIEDSPRSGTDAGRVMDDPTSTLILPMIALAEACWAVERGRSTIPSVAALLADIDADPRIVLVPLDRAILDRSLALTAVSEMHDRQIVATALMRAAAGSSVVLLTRDVNITASGIVATLW
jgi:PIN domain nuclease of toxin-antitoxin system